MASISEIMARAAALRDETALNSIDPERAGSIMYDTLAQLNELWLSEGSALVISKLYSSVSAMNADTSPVSDLTGRDLIPGQIVAIASSNSDNGKVYRYNGSDSPRWTQTGTIGNIPVVNNLTSDSTTTALSAAMGKALKALLDEGYLFMGIGTTTTSPGTPSGKVFYIVPAGTYTNFGSTSRTVDDGYLGIFKYTGSAWAFETVKVSVQLANNLTTEDITKALAAPQGKVLDEKISQLGQEVDKGISDIIGFSDITSRFTWTRKYFVVGRENQSQAAVGSVQAAASTSTQLSNLLDVSAYKYLRITVVHGTESLYSGLCFYDENNNVLDAHCYNVGLATPENIEVLLEIPEGTKYVRTTQWNDGVHLFHCYASVSDINLTKLDERLDSLEMTERQKLQGITSIGAININNAAKTISCTENVVLQKPGGGEYYTIPANSSFPFSFSLEHPTVIIRKLVFNYDNLSIDFLLGSDVTEYPVICYIRMKYAAGASSQAEVDTSYISEVLWSIIPIIIDDVPAESKYIDPAIIQLTGTAISAKLEQGALTSQGIKSNDVSPSSAYSKRVRLTNMFLVNGPFKLSITEGYYYAIHYFDERQQVHLNSTGVWSNDTEHFYNHYGYINITIKKGEAGTEAFTPSDVALTVTLLNTNSESTNQRNIEKSAIAYSVGSINIDNVNHKISLDANLVMSICGSNYTIPSGHEIEQNRASTTPALMALCFDYANLRLVEQGWGEFSKWPIIMTYQIGSATTIDHVIHSIVPYTIDGVNIDTRVSDLEEAVSDSLVVKAMGEEYYGEPLRLNYFALERLFQFNNAGFCQAMAVYGDYCLMFNNNTQKANLFSMSTHNSLASLTIPHGSYYQPHCNTAVVGKTFHSANSIMPLIYVSQWDAGHERACFVYDLTFDGTDYELSLVQLINLSGVSPSIIGTGECDFVVDTDNDIVYAIAYKTTNSSTVTMGTATMICTFALPSTANSEVLITDTDIIRHEEIELIAYRQDAMYNNGKLLIMYGGLNNIKAGLAAVDCASLDIVTEMPLYKFADSEPEGIGIYKRSIVIKFYFSGSSSNTNNLYRLDC